MAKGVYPRETSEGVSYRERREKEKRTEKDRKGDGQKRGPDRKGDRRIIVLFINA